MKKIFMSLVLFTTVLFPQIQIDVGNLTVFNDSLYFGLPGDSVYQIFVNGDYDWMKIYIEGNANSSVDSLSLRQGMIKFNNTTKVAIKKVIGDSVLATDSTLWGDNAGLKDSLVVVSTLINNSFGKTFYLDDVPYGIYELYFLNYRAALATRKVSFSIVLKKSK